MRSAIGLVVAIGMAAGAGMVTGPQVAEGRWQAAAVAHLQAQGAGKASARDTVPSALVGTWEGTVALDSGSLGDGTPIRLAIARDGSVTGTVGSATLEDGHFGRNPGLLSRLFGLGTPWLLTARLEGVLDSATTLRRERATMPLDLVDGELRGDFNAAGGGRLLSVRTSLRRL